MTELMRELYQYSSRTRIVNSLDDYEQYCESSKRMDQTFQALQELLNPEELQKLQNYLGEKDVLHDLELEAAFCAGFSIGQELSRV